MKRKYTDKQISIEQVLLQLVKDEYPNHLIALSGPDEVILRQYGPGPSFIFFQLDDNNIGPIWRRNARYIIEYFKFDYKAIVEISFNLESIARHICDMKHPEGIEI